MFLRLVQKIADCSETAEAINFKIDDYSYLCLYLHEFQSQGAFDMMIDRYC